MLNEKVFFDGGNLTEDYNCSLNPPRIFTEKEIIGHDYYSAEKRKWQSAPCITKAYGQLFCCFTGDNHGGDEQPNNYNVILRSKDGKNFETVMVIDHFDSVRMHEPIIWTDAEGQLWHFWAQSYEWWDGRGGVWAIKISVEGDEITYTEPKRLCHGVMATPPITLKNGKTMLPVSIWKPWQDRIHKYPENGESSVYLCDGDMENCTYVGGASAKTSTFDENTIAELDDGRLFMTIRCEKTIDCSYSCDSGKTWSEPQKLMDHTSSRSYLGKLPSGNLILVTNNDAKERTNMTAFISKDGGATFEPRLLLEPRSICSYPAGFIDGDGRVYVAFDRNRYVEEEVYYSTFTEDDLEKGEIVTEGSFLKRLISKGGSGKATDKAFETGF